MAPTDPSGPAPDYSEFLRAEAERRRAELSRFDSQPCITLSCKALSGIVKALDPPVRGHPPRHYTGCVFIFPRTVPADPFGGHGFPTFQCSDGIYRTPPADVPPLILPCTSVLATDGRIACILDVPGSPPGGMLAVSYSAEALHRMVRGAEVVTFSGHGTRAFAPTGAHLDGATDCEDPRRWGASLLDPDCAGAGRFADPCGPVAVGAIACPLLSQAASLYAALTQGLRPADGNDGCDVRVHDLSPDLTSGKQRSGIALRSGVMYGDPNKGRPADVRVTVYVMASAHGAVRP